MEVYNLIVEKIFKNDVNAVKDLLSRKDFKVDMCDENGMTVLQHAAYKGNKEIIRMLLDQGADVNVGRHEHGYTTLHFAALSGNREVCELLLEQGAKPNCTNSVGRTPAQMGAFVGNHSCVSVINNFIPKSEIDYYTKPSGFETEPKLPPLLSGPLHKFVMQVNLNPVRLGINMIKIPILYENIEKVKNVLELMSQREMKKGIESNEILSFKFHYQSCVLAEIINIKKTLEEQSKTNEMNAKEIDPIQFFIKKMLKINKGVLPEYQENLLKEIIRSFPYTECTIFRQMVCTLSREDSPGALSVINAIVNGHREFSDSDIFTCAACDEERASKKCSQCKSVHYCDKECQKYHWFVHKKFCLKTKNPQNHEEENGKSKETEVAAGVASVLSEMETLKVT